MNSSNPISGSARQFNSRGIKSLVVAIVGIIMVVGSQYIQMSPVRAFGGTVWARDGIHYIDNAQMSARAIGINAPLEAKIAEQIGLSTQSCEKVDTGYCQQSPSAYVDKELIKPAVEFVPAIPDRKLIIGYCTLCGDGTFSPSCAVGRGACSWHSGVSAYNVARYRIIPGKPAIAAEPAVYSYTPKSYQDSPSYTKPDEPNLATIVKFVGQ